MLIGRRKRGLSTAASTTPASAAEQRTENGGMGIGSFLSRNAGKLALVGIGGMVAYIYRASEVSLMTVLRQACTLLLTDCDISLLCV